LVLSAPRFTASIVIDCGGGCQMMESEVAPARLPACLPNQPLAFARLLVACPIRRFPFLLLFTVLNSYRLRGAYRALHAN